MKNKLNKVLLSAVTLALLSGCGPSGYNGMVDVIGIGAGVKPTTTDKQYINQNQYHNAQLMYTNDINIKEQDVNKKTKYVLGDSLSKEYSGKPKLLVDYLNAHQKFSNLTLIVDKNGVVAWEGYLKTLDFKNAYGVSDYGFTGAERISFDEAMQKFVGDTEKAEEYKKDKKIIFASNLSSGFSNDKKYPFLFTKLPEMKLNNAKNNNELSLTQFTQDGKPTVVVFYMAQGKKGKDLSDDINTVKNVFSAFTGVGATKDLPTPNKLFQAIEEKYFKK